MSSSSPSGPTTPPTDRGTNRWPGRSRPRPARRPTWYGCCPTASPRRWTAYADRLPPSWPTGRAARPSMTTPCGSPTRRFTPATSVHLTADRLPSPSRGSDRTVGVAAALSATDGFAARPTGGSWTVNARVQWPPRVAPRCSATSPRSASTAPHRGHGRHPDGPGLAGGHRRGLFSFGDLRLLRLLAGIPLTRRWWAWRWRLVAATGRHRRWGVLLRPGAAFHGSTRRFVPPPLVAGPAPRHDGGYTVVGANGTEYPFPA